MNVRPGWALVLSMGLVCAGVDAQMVEPLRVVSDVVLPSRILPGEVAVRRSVVILPEGTVLIRPDLLDLGPLAEASGTVRVAREPEDGGLVRWTLAYPFTSWAVGVHEVGPLELRASVDGRTLTASLAALAYAVDDMLPEHLDADPAPAEPPFAPSRIPWPAVPLVPAVIVLLTGAGWWRTARSASATPADPTPPLLDPIREIREALGEVEQHPGRTLRQIAALIRDVPALRAMGVTSASTTSEVIRIVSAHRGEASARVIGPLLWSADALCFGRVEPAASDVDAWARALLELVDA